MYVSIITPRIDPPRLGLQTLQLMVHLMTWSRSGGVMWSISGGIIRASLWFTNKSEFLDKSSITIVFFFDVFRTEVKS